MLQQLYLHLSSPTLDLPFLLTLLLIESILCYIIIQNVSYTEIDWIAYMEEVSTYQDGERDYRQIQGGTGPLVYPAGFLYLYSLLRYIAGGDGHDIYMAQILFGVLYVTNSMVVLVLYGVVSRLVVGFVVSKEVERTKDKEEEIQKQLISAHITWSWRISMILTCLSKRIHSIYVLRLFNDAPAMFFLYISISIFSTGSMWRLGCFFFSVAVSIKMNVLLFAPGLLLLLLQSSPDFIETCICLSVCAVVQLILGAPFLLTYPVSYLRKAFEFDRVFFYKWTVNWKFLPEDIFVSKPLSSLLLFLHVSFLVIFAIKWLRASKQQTGARIFLCKSSNASESLGCRRLSPEYIIQTMFVSNFVGIVFARTLHYQFYCWYFHSVPFMLCLMSTVSRTTPSFMMLVLKMLKNVALLGCIEYSFNVYPATATSSVMLQISHLVVLGSLLFSVVPTVLTEFDEITITSNEKEKKKNE